MYLEVTIKHDVGDTKVRPSVTWSVGPGDPSLLGLIRWRMELNSADVVVTRNEEGYLRWRTYSIPTEDELYEFNQRVHEVLYKILRELNEFRLFHKAIAKEQE